MNKILKKKSFGFGKKKFGSDTDTDTFDQYHNRYRILVSHYKKHMTWSVCKGQIISECPDEIIICPKIAAKKFPRFLS